MTYIDLPAGDRLALHGLSAPEAERGSIVRLGPNGRRLWIAHPPKGDAQDAFVAMQLKDGVLLADSFQGLRLRLDPETGAALGSDFVK